MAREYIVYRHGHNEQTQGAGLPDKMAVARISADSPEEACGLASRDVVVAAGQHLTAEPADVVDAKENDLSRRVEALDQG